LQILGVRCDIQECDKRAGFPNSIFPGLSSEDVCSQDPCDPQILKLYKNTSVITKENLQSIEVINRNNQRSGFSWVAGETSLVSLSYSDIQAFKMGEIPPTSEDRQQSPEKNRARKAYLLSIEEKRKNRVNFPSPYEVFTTDANNQGFCSSCSAFAVTAAIETCIAKVVANPVFRSAPPRGLSAQNMLDCAFGRPGIYGCDGGRSFRYLAWSEGRELDTNRQYPYADSSLKYEGLVNSYRECYQSRSDPLAVVETTHSSWDDHRDRDIENILLEGNSVVTTMDVPEDFMFYKSGVYESSECQNWSLGPGRDFQWELTYSFRPLRHAVVIIGFGEENGKRYWKVKNSWGENWGESGFFRIVRNKDGSAHCGIGAYFSAALCKTCKGSRDCQARGNGVAQPPARPPPRLPDEGIASGFTSHLATPVGGVGETTCSTCGQSCPPLRPCRTRRRRCCRVVGGWGNRLYCPSRC